MRRGRYDIRNDTELTRLFPHIEATVAMFPGAKPKLIQHNFQPWIVKPLRGLCIHIDGGQWVPGKGAKPGHFARGSIDGIFGDFNTAGSGKSAHFGVAKDGDIFQFLDTSKSCFAVDGTYRGTDSYWISVENIAVPGDDLTDEQVSACADIFRWLNQTESVPLQLALTKDSKGLGYHSLFLTPEGARQHPCPTPHVILQLPEIVRQAQEWWKD